MEVGRSFDLSLPICAASLVRGNNRMYSGIMWWLTVNGRLKPGWTHIVPLRDWGGGSAWIDGAARQPKPTRLSRVGPGYFQTLEVPLVAGRDFDSRDRVGAPARLRSIRLTSKA